MTTLVHAAEPVKPTAPAPLAGWHPAIARFLLGIPEVAALAEAISTVDTPADVTSDDLAPADEYGPEHDAWRWELGPEPSDDDRAWWREQDIDGGVVDGESTPAELEQRAGEAAALDRMEAGLGLW